MRVVWMSTGSDDRTRFEDLEIASTDCGRGFETPVLPTTGAIFRTGQPEVDLDFHNAPRRQFVIPLGGEIEVEAGDGTKRYITTGQALLADDVTGQGHKTRFIGEGVSALFLLLPDDLDPATWR